MAYRTGSGSRQQLTWVDRDGTALGTLGEPDDILLAPRLSPDGRRVAVGRIVQGNVDIWLLDGARRRWVAYHSDESGRLSDQHGGG